MSAAPISTMERYDLLYRLYEEFDTDTLLTYQEFIDLFPPVDSRVALDHWGDASEQLKDQKDEIRTAFPQVGETFAGRAGNTVTHLLDQEGVASAAVTEPAAVFCARQEVDEAAMKLRRAPVVLGPGTRGRVYFAGFTEPIDFTDAYTPPALRTLTDRAGDAGHDVDYLGTLPLLETPADLAEILLGVGTRRTAGRPVPTHVADWLDDSALTVVADGAGGLALAGE